MVGSWFKQNLQKFSYWVIGRGEKSFLIWNISYSNLIYIYILPSTMFTMFSSFKENSNITKEEKIGYMFASSYNFVSKLTVLLAHVIGGDYI